MDINEDNDDNNNNNGMEDEVSSRGEVLAGDGYKNSDGKEAIPDEVPHAHALSHMINWSSSSSGEEEEEDEEEQVVATKSDDDKYEYMSFTPSTDFASDDRSIADPVVAAAYKSEKRKGQANENQ